MTKLGPVEWYRFDTKERGRWERFAAVYFRDRLIWWPRWLASDTVQHLRDSIQRRRQMHARPKPPPDAASDAEIIRAMDNAFGSMDAMFDKMSKDMDKMAGTAKASGRPSGSVRRGSTLYTWRFR